jgi:hypothetical protein
MSPQSSFKNRILNPFSSQSSLSNLEKTRELIRGGSDITVGIIYIVFLLILAFILVDFIKIPVFIVAILIGTEILITLIGGYIKVAKMKSLYAIDTRDIAQSYRTILITSEYYKWIETVIGLIASAISSFFVIVTFFQEISSFIIEIIPANIPISPSLLKYIVFIFVVVRLFNFPRRLIKYNWVKDISESDSFAKVNQEYLLIDNKIAMIMLFLGGSIVLLILLFLDVPFYILLLATGPIFIMFVFSIGAFLRLKNLEFDDNAIDASVAHHKIEKYPEEQIVGTVFGVMRSAASIKEYFQTLRIPLFGTGERFFSENTLLVSNYRLIFLQIPTSGGNKIVGGTDYVTANFMFNRGEIRQKGEAIIKRQDFSQILSLATGDVLWTDIKILTLKKGRIDIEKVTGQKLIFLFRDREYVESLKQLLRPFLNEKFIQMC